MLSLSMEVSWVPLVDIFLEKNSMMKRILNLKFNKRRREFYLFIKNIYKISKIEYCLYHVRLSARDS